MNKLPTETRARILAMLCEGSSMRSISRVCDVSFNTIAKLLVDAGVACAEFHDTMVRNVESKRVQADEIWSFCYAKKKNLPSAKAAPEGAGDVWTFTAIDADTKLMISWLVGSRDGEAAWQFMLDLNSRLANRVQLTTDGFPGYRDAVAGSFGDKVDYAQLIKLFGLSYEGKAGTAERRYSPAAVIGTRRDTVFGNPDQEHVSTSFVERQNLTMRMSMRRFTRLTNAFSKKFENHCHALALFYMWYNWIRVHKTLRTSPAMAAGLTDKLLDWSHVVEMIDAREQVQIAAKRRAMLGPLDKISY